MDKNGTTRSPLCTTYTEADATVQVEICQLGWSDGWTLELVHPDGGWTIWLSEFATDDAAMAEFAAQIGKTGLANLIAGERFHFDAVQ